MLDLLDGDSQRYAFLESCFGSSGPVFGIPANSLTSVLLSGFRFPEEERWVSILPFYTPLKKEFTIFSSMILDWNNSTNPS